VLESWLPKSIVCLRDYSWRLFLRDALAGLTVGLVALPLAMAFAISSGLAPQAGIYCAVVTGFLISALGGSRNQIGGPTGAFVVVVAGIVATHGLEGLFMCTMMAGVLLLIAGATGMGSMVRFIPRPVVVGFTNGIALLIASTQLKDFFGLQVAQVPGEFLERLRVLAAHAGTMSWEATALAGGGLVLMIVVRQLTVRVPPTIVALVTGTVVTVALGLSVETVGSRFGGLPSGWPSVHLPRFRFDLVLGLISPALTVALLGAIESLLSAVVADRMTGDRHNPNVELIAQGVANIASPLFGGLPATGAIARTATNIRSGAATPVAGMIHAVTLLVVLLVAAPLASYIPMAVLASILMMVAWNMGEWAEIPDLLKLSRADIAVWLVTFTLTVLADLTVAVEVGMVLATALFIRKVVQTTTVSEVTDEDVEDGRVHILQDKQIPDYVAIFRIHGPFLFGATDKLEDVTARMAELPPIVIIRLRNMTAIDATGLRALEDLADRMRESGRTLLLCGAREQPRRLMRQAEFDQHVGADNLCDNIQHALDRARQVYAARASAGAVAPLLAGTTPLR
jgi:SulP family sulfate permease